MPTARSATPCPRCDYDLSGAHDSWTESCPLDGRCSECGLDFRWAEVLNPALTYPKWSFEHARSRLLRKWAATALRTATPRTLWRELKIEHLIIAKRLTVFMLSVCLAVHLLAACMGAMKTRQQSFRTTWYASPTYPSGRAGVPHSPRFYDCVPGFLWPYGWPKLDVDSNGVDWFERHKVIRPRSVFRSISYPTSWIVQMSICALLTPLSLLFAPDTLRGYRIRKAHFARAWVYALPSVAVMSAAMYSLESLSPERGNWLNAFQSSRWAWTAEAIAHAVCRILPLMWLIWYVWWWRSAVKHYLRLPQVGRTTACTLGIGALASFGVVGYFPGSQLINYFGELLYYLRVH